MAIRIVCDLSHVGVRKEAELADEAAIVLGRPTSNQVADMVEVYRGLNGHTTLFHDGPYEYGEEVLWDGNNNDPTPYLVMA